jgi:hypothetical protein
MIKKLFLTAALLAPSLAYGDASVPLSLRIIPASATCQLGNHGPVRGWARVANGTLVADDGCLLQMSYSNLVPFGGIGTLAEYQDVHNNGHYNTYRYTIFLGGFYDDSQSGQTIASIEAQLDSAIAFTQQSGLYLLIDNHNTLPSSGNEGCPDWPANVAIWTAIAPRYANDTNVIYQIQNEPDNCGSENYTDIATHMNSLYNLIRSFAPNTPIMAWSFENPSFPQNAGLLNVLSQAPSINYSNATVDFHEYSGGDTTFIATARGSGYPVTMSEYGVCVGGAWDTILSTLVSLGVSWACGDGYPDGNSAAVVTWPED